MVLIIDRKRSIGQASMEVGVQEHVLRFWETQFCDYIKPTIGTGNRRYFYDRDIKILKTIKYYLYEKGYTIKGLKNLIKNETLMADDEVFANKNDSTMPASRSLSESPAAINSSQYNLNSSLRDELKTFKIKLNNFYEKLKNI
ncbi:MAG: MerR family transcriptional regulator [Rickettsiales bacterium]|jgi:DNA-binding transcriptional MerR regulator|nr:MerR family transcriptional regulator [Rickettsiales bacterium]